MTWESTNGYWKYTPTVGDPTYPDRPESCTDDWYWHAGFGYAVRFPS